MTKMKKTETLKKSRSKKTEWIFAFNYDGVLPVFIKFTTNKSKSEIKKKFGGNNSYNDENGMGVVSICYCDEYTDEYSELGHNLVNHGAMYGVFDVDEDQLKIINTDLIPVVDLDLAFSQPKIEDTGYYDLVW